MGGGRGSGCWHVLKHDPCANLQEVRMQMFHDLLSRLHIAHCNHSRD